MASVFTLIINGDLPGHFVHRDDICVAFLSIEPLREGHTLVVPVAEIDHWLDLDPTTLNHLTEVSRRIGAAIQSTFPSKKVGMMIAGLEVPHVHIHLVPIDAPDDLDFANASPASSEDLALVAERLRVAIDG